MPSETTAPSLTTTCEPFAHASTCAIFQVAYSVWSCASLTAADLALFQVTGGAVAGPPDPAAPRSGPPPDLVLAPPTIASPAPAPAAAEFPPALPAWSFFEARLQRRPGRRTASQRPRMNRRPAKSLEIARTATKERGMSSKQKPNVKGTPYCGAREAVWPQQSHWAKLAVW